MYVLHHCGLLLGGVVMMLGSETGQRKPRGYRDRGYNFTIMRDGRRTGVLRSRIPAEVVGSTHDAIGSGRLRERTCRL